MTLDIDDSRPRYVQVTDALVRTIADGKLAPGDRAPSAREISESFNISQMTAQRVLKELKDLGLVAPQQGRGTYVRPEAAAIVATMRDQPTELEPMTRRLTALEGEVRRLTERVAQLEAQDAKA